jgi:hypothetical protein
VETLLFSGSDENAKISPTTRAESGNDWCVFRIFADTLEIWAILRMNLNGADGSQRWRMACKGFSADTTKLVSLQHRQLVDDPMNSRVSACGEMKAARTPNAQSPKSATGHAGCEIVRAECGNQQRKREREKGQQADVAKAPIYAANGKTQ